MTLKVATTMQTPCLIDVRWFYDDKNASSDTDEPWTISPDRIKVIQKAFIGYMEQGLDMRQIALHVDPLSNDDYLECIYNFCAASISLPHPRLPDLIEYISELCKRDDEHQWLNSIMEKIHNVNRFRKLEVIRSLDYQDLQRYLAIFPITNDDASLICLTNDADLIKLSRDYITDQVKKWVLPKLRINPERKIGWIDHTPAFISNTEILQGLKSYAKAATGCNLGGQALLDHEITPALGSLDLSQPFKLSSLENPRAPLEFLTLPQLHKAAVRMPFECLQAVREGLGSSREENEEFTGDLPDLLDTLENAGISRQTLFYYLCQNHSQADILDMEDLDWPDHHEYLRDTVRFLRGSWSSDRNIMATHLFKKESIEDVLKACFSDRLLNLAYAITPDQRLLKAMGNEGRDNAFSNDLGL